MSELSNVQVSGDSVGCQSRRVVNSPLGAGRRDFDGAVTGDKIGGTCRDAIRQFPVFRRQRA